MSVHYETIVAARDHLKDLLDAADAGIPATMKRGKSRVAVVDAERLRHFLSSISTARAEASHEDGWWSVFIPGLPIAAEGSTLDDAYADMVEALREYAKDWNERLRHAPNHSDNWGLVQLIDLSSDSELKDWLTS